MVFIIFPTDFCVYRQMFADVIGNDDIRIVDSKSCFPYAIYSVRESIRSKMHIPGRRMNKGLLTSICKYAFRNVSENSQNYTVLFVGLKWPVDCGLVEYIRNHYEAAKIVCYETDLLSGDFSDILRYKSKYNIVIDYDKKECNKYGFEYYGTPNSLKRLPEKEPAHDICFVGQAKNRVKDIYSIYEYLTTNGVNCDFWILRFRGKKKRGKGLHYRWRIPYARNFKIIANSRGILEITQKGAVGYTTRATEALLYNKLLVTNSDGAREIEWYDEGKIIYFSTCDDISVDHILSIESFRFRSEYSENISPWKLLSFIESKMMKC